MFLNFINLVIGVFIITDLLPLKYEAWDRDTIRANLWKVCVAYRRPRITCFPDAYHEAPEAWFFGVQALLTLPLLPIFTSFAYLFFAILLTNNQSTRRNYYVSLWLHLIAAAIYFFPIVMLNFYFPFDQIQPTREWKVGWTEETEPEEWWGENYYIAWAAFTGNVLCAILAPFVACKDAAFRMELKNAAATAVVAAAVAYAGRANDKHAESNGVVLSPLEKRALIENGRVEGSGPRDYI